MDAIACIVLLRMPGQARYGVSGSLNCRVNTKEPLVLVTILAQDLNGGRMRALRVEYNTDTEKISHIAKQKTEDWITVCERFNNDVHRICDIKDRDMYTALYQCYDDDNKPSYYLVEEDRQLDKVRRKVFYNKLGRDT
jgi:hypothetical protein